jgi:redox-sensitive bicupin YhaK (pirin superfamily)
MIDVRPFERLGRFDNDWLNARYHFSFSNYSDPARMGWGSLRVWNDDRIRPHTGFPPHGHRDMEIITYVRSGRVTHRDHLGNEGVTEAGDVQVMSAGRGIQHEEWNQDEDPAEIFQIWIMPNAGGVAPRWETRKFPKADRTGQLVALASGRPDDGDALTIHQDAAILGATLQAGQSVTHQLGGGRKAYLVAAKGRIRVNGKEAKARDGVAVSDERELKIEALEDSEILLADLA